MDSYKYIVVSAYSGREIQAKMAEPRQNCNTNEIMCYDILKHSSSTYQKSRKFYRGEKLEK
jgi:hypothetical protein